MPNYIRNMRAVAKGGATGERSGLLAAASGSASGGAEFSEESAIASELCKMLACGSGKQGGEVRSRSSA